MSTYISRATGNFTDASTWALVGHEMDSEAGYSSVLYTYSASQNFSLSAMTVDGVAIKMSYIGAAPTSGTLSLKIYSVTAGSDVAGTEVTVNLSGLFSQYVASSAASNYGWRFIKFPSPVALTAATYNLQVKKSFSSNVTLYCSSTIYDWSRMLRTTTTGAPTTGDKWHVLGEVTGSGVTPITVTMNNNDSRDFGDGSTTIPAFTVGRGGILNWKTDANTYLKLSGILASTEGGKINESSATRIGSGYTATILFDCAATGDFGIKVLGCGEFNAYGAVKNLKTLLTSDAAAGATTLSVADTSDWAAGDLIRIGASQRTWNQYEDKTINSIVSGTSLTITSATSYQHYGTKPYDTPVVNLSNRNFKILGTSSSVGFYIYIGSGGKWHFENTEFRYYGTSNTGKLGIELYNLIYKPEFVGCVWREASNTWARQLSVNITDTLGFSVTDSVMTGLCIGIYIAYTPSTSGSVTLQRNTFVGGGAANGGAAMLLKYCGLSDFTVEDNDVVGWNGDGLNLSDTIYPFRGTVRRNRLLSMSSYGMNLAISGGMDGGTITNNITAFNTAGGFNIGGATNLIRIENHISFGEYCIYNSPGTSCLFKNLRTSGFSKGAFSYAGYGVYIPQNVATTIYFEDCFFGYSTGEFTGHTNDIYSNPTVINWPRLFLKNCIFGSTVEISSLSSTVPESFIISLGHDGSPTVNRAFKRDGVLTNDTVIYSAASPSWRLTPNNATNRLSSYVGEPYYDYQGGGFKVAVKAGETATVSVKVRETVTGDGQDYNGQRARLLVAEHPALLTNLVTNGSFTTDTSGWTGDNAVLSSVSGGASGNCLKLQSADAGNAQARQTLTTEVGKTYRVQARFQKQTADGGRIKVGTSAGASDLAVSNLETFNSGWGGIIGVTFKATSTTTYLTLESVANSADVYSYWDEVTCYVLPEPMVLATATAASEGAWETLSGTTPAVSEDCVLMFYVDCGGTGYSQGWVNVDDWQNTSPKNDTKGLQFWPHLVGDNSSGGGSTPVEHSFAFVA